MAGLRVPTKLCPTLGTTLAFSVARPPARPLEADVATILLLPVPRKELAGEETPVCEYGARDLVPSTSVDDNT